MKKVLARRATPCGTRGPGKRAYLVFDKWRSNSRRGA